MMFLLAPLLGWLIGVIIYYTAVDMRAYRKRKQRWVIDGCEEAHRRMEAYWAGRGTSYDRNRLPGERLGPRGGLRVSHEG